MRGDREAAVRRNQFSDCLHIVSPSSKSMKCEVVREGACFLFSSYNDLKGLYRKLLIVCPHFFFFISFFIYLTMKWIIVLFQI